MNLLLHQFSIVEISDLMSKCVLPTFSRAMINDSISMDAIEPQEIPVV